MNVVGKIHTYFLDFVHEKLENDSESDIISGKAGIDVDGAPVWHSVSRRGAGCCL